jgi:Leucine-rich repeat (LRR) protein
MASQIKAHFEPNKLLAVNQRNGQHQEVQARLTVAKKSNALHLNQLNLDVVLPEVFRLSNLVRLDLSFNNIVKLSPQVKQLGNLQQLWLNDNPIRELPLEVSECLQLREIDVRNTFIITLPRELANLANLLYLNLDGCPLKETLGQTYSEGMSAMHTQLRRKEDRKLYKEQLFNHLTEWVYPSEPKEHVFEQVEVLFAQLKDCNTEMLKKLHRNSQMLFPKLFADIDPLRIRSKLFDLYEEGVAREDIAQLQLRIKSHFIDEPLHIVVQIATDIFHHVKDSETIDQFFRYKRHVFTGSLGELTAQKLLDNLAAYKERKRQERLQTIEFLKSQIDNHYSDEGIKEEKLQEYTQDLVAHLKRTSFIKLYAQNLAPYMPKYNELKNFKAAHVVPRFVKDFDLRFDKKLLADAV